MRLWWVYARRDQDYVETAHKMRSKAAVMSRSKKQKRRQGMRWAKTKVVTITNANVHVLFERLLYSESAIHDCLPLHSWASRGISAASASKQASKQLRICAARASEGVGLGCSLGKQVTPICGGGGPRYAGSVQERKVTSKTHTLVTRAVTHDS